MLFLLGGSVLNQNSMISIPFPLAELRPGCNGSIRSGIFLIFSGHADIADTGLLIRELRVQPARVILQLLLLLASVLKLEENLLIAVLKPEEIN